MNSFYGGKHGKDFSVKQIFRNKTELINDLEGRITPLDDNDQPVTDEASIVGINELAFISYGDNNYESNMNDDKEKFGKNYNNTLWKKVFIADGVPQLNNIEIIESELVPEVKYIMLANLSGSSTKVTVGDTIVLDADEDPFVTTEIGDNDYTKLIFHLPQSQIFQVGTVAEIKTTEKPEVIIDTGINNEFINNPKLNFKIPVGEALNIVANYTITSEQVLEDTLELVSSYIEEQFGGIPDSDELIGVTYKNLSPPEGDDGLSSYWYYYVQGKWERAVLGGGVGNGSIFWEEF